jgi:hypothetical protein
VKRLLEYKEEGQKGDKIAATQAPSAAAITKIISGISFLVKIN